MPHKVWAVGEEALAADMNSLVQEQVVATFPNAAARDAAIVAPKTGQHCYLASDGRTYVYDGLAWAALLTPGTERVVGEVIRTGDSGGVGSSSVVIPGHGITITPRANCNYYARFGCRIAPTAAACRVMLVPQGGPGAPSATQLQQWEFSIDVSSYVYLEGILNPTPPVGAPYLINLVARALSTPTFVLTGAVGRYGIWQIVERPT